MKCACEGLNITPFLEAYDAKLARKIYSVQIVMMTISPCTESKCTKLTNFPSITATKIA